MSAKLFLNPRWRLGDIIKVLERTQKHKVEVVSCHEIGVGFYYFNVANRQIAVFVNKLCPTGATTALHINGDAEGIKILKAVANVFGGILLNDSDDTCKWINGAMVEDDGLPYFVRYAIVHDGINPDDTQAFIDSKRKWHKRVENKDMPEIH